MRLRGEQGFEGLPEAILFARRLEDGHYLVRAIMKGRITQYEPDPIWIGCQYLFHLWIKSAAGLAGGIEKFNDHHRRIGAPDCRRMHTHQIDGGSHCWLCCWRGLFIFVEQGRTQKGEGEHRSCRDKERFLFHCLLRE